MRLDEMTPGTVWDAVAVAGVGVLMLPPWVAVAAGAFAGSLWLTVHLRPPK